MSYSLKIGGAIALNNFKDFYHCVSDAHYVPDFPDIQTPYYFSEATKKRFYLLPNIVEDSSSLFSVYD